MRTTPLGPATPVFRPDTLSRRLAPLRARLLAHPVYTQIDSVDHLKVFMGLHVFAVWDFMSLVKRLQADLCGTALPWRPPADAALARFVNEIVLAEESDVGPDGRPVSHLSAYRHAMAEVFASDRAFAAVIHALSGGHTVEAALSHPAVPAAARVFSTHTLQLTRHGTTAEVAAAFLYGREDVIPDMFQRILDGSASGWGAPQHTRWLRWYLARHIELDGDEHGPLAERLLARLCGDDPTAWTQAEAAARGAINARLTLWDGVVTAL